MAEIGLTNSSVTNSPITPIPCLQLLAHNCLGQKGNFSWVSDALTQNHLTPRIALFLGYIFKPPIAPQMKVQNKKQRDFPKKLAKN